MIGQDVQAWADSDQLEDGPQTEWINVALAEAESGTVARLVPSVFEKYIRVLHPPSRTVDDVPVEYFTWSDVARACGAVPHSRMQWGSITSTADPGSGTEFWNTSPASTHSIPTALMRAMASILGAEDRCYFGFWEGNTAVSGVNGQIPRAVVGRYRFHMFEGRASDSVKRFHGLRPGVWWSVDRSWFVTSDPDLNSTYIGVGPAVADIFLSASALETWRVGPTDDVTADGDGVNGVLDAAVG